MHLEGLEDVRHLQTSEWLISELLEEIAHMFEGDAVSSLDNLASEQLPLLLGHLL